MCNYLKMKTLPTLISQTGKKGDTHDINYLDHIGLLCKKGPKKLLA